MPAQVFGPDGIEIQNAAGQTVIRLDALGGPSGDKARIVMYDAAGSPRVLIDDDDDGDGRAGVEMRDAAGNKIFNFEA